MLPANHSSKLIAFIGNWESVWARDLLCWTKLYLWESDKWTLRICQNAVLDFLYQVSFFFQAVWTCWIWTLWTRSSIFLYCDTVYYWDILKLRTGERHRLSSSTSVEILQSIQFKTMEPSETKLQCIKPDLKIYF